MNLKSLVGKSAGAVGKVRGAMRRNETFFLPGSSVLICFVSYFLGMNSFVVGCYKIHKSGLDRHQTDRQIYYWCR